MDENMYTVGRIFLSILVLLVFACTLKEPAKNKNTAESANDCSPFLKNKEDSAVAAWIGFNENDDTIQSRKTFKIIVGLADSGCAKSQYIYGYDLIDSNNVKALNLLKSASEKGSAEASFELYKRFMQGHWEDNNQKWVLKDSGLAQSYFVKALSKNYSPALVDLANAKIKEAFLLYKQAADSGSLDGMKSTARAYEYGIGVEDELSIMYDKAYLYYSIAARFSAPAGECRDYLEKARKFEAGKSKLEIMRLHEYVQGWFDKHLKIKNELKDDGKCP